MSNINIYFDEEKIPDKNIKIKNTKWKRFDKWANKGTLYWARPIHHNERNWNRHDISIKGESNYPTYTIELIYQKENEFGIRVTRTQGPNEKSPGMGGVVDCKTTSNIESAVKEIKSFMKKYTN